MLKRIVIKLSGEAIGSANSGNVYDDIVVDSIVSQIVTVLQAGTEVSIVVGGGNIWRGLNARPDMDRVKADQMGMLATIMNAVYLKEAFKRQGQKCRVLTPMPVGNITTVYDKDAAMDWMSRGIVLINAAGLGHPMFSTDTVTALRAAELEADCALYAKNIDGVYNSDPKNNPKARKYETLSYQTAINQNLQAADMTALHISKDAAIPAYMFGLSQPNSIIDAAAFPNTKNLKGTYIHVDKEDKFYD